MSAMETGLPAAPSHCGYCGCRIAEEVAAPHRFGERFCSKGHADEFAAGVRAARIRAAARREDGDARPAATGGTARALPPAGQGSWRDALKRAACWGAPVLLLLAIPLIWSGGWAAAGAEPGALQPVFEHVHALTFDAAGRALWLGAHAGLYRSEDSGRTWAKAILPPLTTTGPTSWRSRAIPARPRCCTSARTRP